jgi:hypothetical protein
MAVIKYWNSVQAAAAWSTDKRYCHPRTVEKICQARGKEFGAVWIGFSDPLGFPAKIKRRGLWLIMPGTPDQRRKSPGRPRKHK